MRGGRPAVSIIGLGKLGAPMAACIASRGVDVIGVDVNQRFVDAFDERRAPIYEPGLDELLSSTGSNLRATADTGDAVTASDITMIVVPTPSEENGDFSLRYVLPACEAIGEALREKDEYHLVCVTSTVMPGSTGGPIRNALEQSSGKQAGVEFGLCYSPEFIALGSVIRDFLNPDFLLIGESDAHAGETLTSLYRRVCEHDPPVARMSFVNAELAKLAVNTYITTKISFANMLAGICEQLPGADVDSVTSALGLDSRIGPKYLKGAISYGGPCFPRDNLALAALARSVDAPATLAEATDRANRERIERLARFVQERLPENGTVAVLGLAYKPDTDVVEESPGLILVDILASDGADVVAYDPAAMANARRVLEGTTARFAETLEDALRGSNLVVVTTPWKEFRELDVSLLEQEAAMPVVIDCWRTLAAGDVARSARYIALGEGATAIDVAAP